MEHRCNKTSLPRRLALLLAGLVFLCAFALPARADEGDYDRIDQYTVTVEPLADGTADITYEIDWQVLAGGADEYLSWVRVGLANRHVEAFHSLSPDVIQSIELVTNGGAYAQVEFQDRYYAPDVAAANGAESSVHFAFRVRQGHLYTLNEDGSASFVFTPGWFDDLNVQSMTVRWKYEEGVLADNPDTDGDWLVWQFGPLEHGQAGTVRVQIPAGIAAGYAAGNSADAPETDDDGTDAAAVVLFTLLLFLILVLIVVWAATRCPRWYGGFGDGLNAADWLWYTNGVHTVRRARTAPPPPGYRPTAPPARFKAGGGQYRGGGAGRSRGSCASSCACACASSCACACACAGGGRAGCSAKNFAKIGLPKENSEKE